MRELGLHEWEEWIEIRTISQFTPVGDSDVPEIVGEYLNVAPSAYKAKLSGLLIFAHSIGQKSIPAEAVKDWRIQ